MKTIKIRVSDTDYQRYNLDNEQEMKFSDLVEPMSLEYARKALFDCNQIAQQAGLADMTMEEINEEVQATRIG